MISKLICECVLVCVCVHIYVLYDKKMARMMN